MKYANLFVAFQEQLDKHDKAHEEFLRVYLENPDLEDDSSFSANDRETARENWRIEKVHLLRLYNDILTDLQRIK